MAALTNLPVLDTPPVEYQKGLDQIMGFWLSDLATSYNQAMTQIQILLTPIVSDIGGGGAGPIVVSVPGLTANSIVTAYLVSSSNPVTIISVVSSANQFSITFSGDPGASAIISYIAFYAAT